LPVSVECSYMYDADSRQLLVQNVILTMPQDYWLSVLYKRLVGTRVLYVMDSLQEGRHVRAYAHCAKPP